MLSGVNQLELLALWKHPYHSPVRPAALCVHESARGSDRC